jgi:CubicO group peptidase (beta-lactamase class C family)
MGLAGVLAERISGKTYAALLDEYIFLPFKLVTPDKTITKTTNKSQGYFGDEKSEYWNMNVLAPAGGLKCTTKEILTYLQYMANPADEKAGEIIEKLLQPTVSLYPKVNVCRAWHTIEEKDKPTIYWHNGGTYGFSTFAAFIKGQQKAVIVVVNKFNESKISDLLGITIMKELIK